MYPYPNI